MNKIAIIENALQTTLRHRALWVLGFLWALGGGATVPTVGGRDNVRWRIDDTQWRDGLGGAPDWLSDPSRVLAWVIALGAIAIVLLVVLVVLKYVAQAGVYRALELLDRDGTAPTVRGSLAEGWHRRTWRLWLQNVVVDVPLVIVAVASLAVALSPLVLLATGESFLQVFGVATAIGTFGMWLIALIVVGVIVSLLKELWWRAAVVDDRSFLTAIRQGCVLARGSPVDMAGMWLLMAFATIAAGAIGLGVAAVSGLVALVVAGGPALVLWRRVSHLAAVVYGVPAGAILFLGPLLLYGGLFLVFRASVWSQVYRQLGHRASDATA